MNEIKIQSIYGVAAIVLTFVLTACDKPGSAEKLGKQLDQSVESSGKKYEDAKDKISVKTDKAEVELEGSVVTTKIKAAIMAEPGLKSLDINVDTVGEIVTLTGKVDSQEKKDKAQELSEAVSGVKQVNNQLVIAP